MIHAGGGDPAQRDTPLSPVHPADAGRDVDAGVPDDLLSEGSPSGTASTTPPRSTPTPARTTTPTVSREEARSSTSSTTTTTMRTVDQNARVARAGAAAASASEVDPLRAVDRPRTTSVASAPATRATADAAHAVVAIATAGAVVAAVGATTAEAAEGPDAPQRPATRLRTLGTIADTPAARARPTRLVEAPISFGLTLRSRATVRPGRRRRSRASASPRRVRPKFRDGRAQTIPPRYAHPADDRSRPAALEDAATIFLSRAQVQQLCAAGPDGPAHSAAAAAHASSVPGDPKHALDALRAARGAIVRVGVGGGQYQVAELAGGAIPIRVGRSRRGSRAARVSNPRSRRSRFRATPSARRRVQHAPVATRVGRVRGRVRGGVQVGHGTPSVGLRRRDCSRYARLDVSRTSGGAGRRTSVAPRPETVEEAHRRKDGREAALLRKAGGTRGTTRGTIRGTRGTARGGSSRTLAAAARSGSSRTFAAAARSGSSRTFAAAARSRLRGSPRPGARTWPRRDRGVEEPRRGRAIARRARRRTDGGVGSTPLARRAHS